jgi:hypothetical protein
MLLPSPLVNAVSSEPAQLARRRRRHVSRLAGALVLVAAMTHAAWPATAANQSTPTTTAGSTAGPASDAHLTMATRAGFAPGGNFMSLTEAEQTRDLDAMAATGAKWFRVGLQWSNIEPSPGAYRWSGPDRLVRLAVERGLQPIVMVAYTPRWARDATCSTSQFCPPATPSTYASFVAAAAVRYAAAGVKVWEIWNEPNTADFWKPGPDATAYTALLEAAAGAIRGVDPGATIVTGGLAPRAKDTASGARPSTFLRQLYAAGAGSSFDGFGMHPYAWPVAPSYPASWNAFFTLSSLYRTMVANGDGAKKIWMTEFGYSTGTWSQASTEAEQAAYLTEAYTSLSSARWAGPLLWFNYRDRGPDPADREQNFGLVTVTGQAKPALHAFVAAMAIPLVTDGRG